MNCPRCGGRLSSYQLGDAETMACDDCVYVGVPVDHTSEPRPRESWPEALGRFYEQHQSTAQDGALVDHEAVAPSDVVFPVFEATDETGASQSTDGDSTASSETASSETTRADSDE